MKIADFAIITGRIGLNDTFILFDGFFDFILNFSKIATYFIKIVIRFKRIYKKIRESLYLYMSLFVYKS